MNQIQMRQCHRKVVSVRRVEGAIRFLVNARGLQHECAKFLRESLLVPQMFARYIRRMDKVPNAWIRELCRVMKVFSDGSTMWREWRMTGLLRGSM